MLEGQWWKTLCTREETRFIRYKPVIVGFRTTSYTFPDNWTAVARDLTVFYDSNRSIDASSLAGNSTSVYSAWFCVRDDSVIQVFTRDRFQVNRSFIPFLPFSLSLFQSPFFLRVYRLWKLSLRLCQFWSIDRQIVVDYVCIYHNVFFMIVRIHNYKLIICTNKKIIVAFRII